MEDRDEKGRFLPGYAGGPGRPPGSVSLLGILKKKLQERDPSDPDERTYADILIERYIMDALENGDGQAIRDMIDRTDGKPKQTIENNVREIENPIYDMLRKVVHGDTEPEAD